MTTVLLEGKKLGKATRLSNLLPSAFTQVRIVGLTVGQTVEVDASIDGGYVEPDGPARWTGPTGLEAVHAGLLAIVKSSGFGLAMTGKAEAKNSRGRGVTISDCDGFAADYLWVNGARSAGIAVQDCERFSMKQPVTVNSSNYQEARTDVDVFNVAGSIKFDNCRQYTVADALSLDHQGNGITATESDGGLWIRPTTLGVYGANQYVNASPNHVVKGGIALGTKTHRPNGYVVNSEKENKGIPSDNAVFEDCLAFDVDIPFGVWGNEGQTIALNRIAVLNGRFVGDETAPKLHNRSPITTFDQTGTKYLATTAIDPTALAAIRNLRNGLADLVRAHADWKVIEAEREALRFAIGTLGGPVVDPDPDPEPLDREALRAMLKEQEALLARIVALVG